VHITNVTKGIKGCPSSFGVNISKIKRFKKLNVATNETTIMQCTMIALKNYNINDQQFNRHDFRWQFLF